MCGVAKTEVRCSVCQSPYRERVDDLLVLARKGESLADGTRVSLSWIADTSPDLFGTKLSRKALTNHRDQHVLFTAETVAPATHLKAARKTRRRSSEFSTGSTLRR